MPGLKKCPDCGGKVENIDADTCTICGSEYLTAVSDEYVEKTVEKILAKKIPSHQETVFRVAAEA